MRRILLHAHRTMPGRRGRAAAAFTVMELMLSIAIMTVIVIALYTVFDQTQRALRSTMSQVDVLEGIRSSADLVGREVEGAGHLPVLGYTNLYVTRNARSVPAKLDRLAGGELLTTVLQDMLFHVKVGEQWAAIGYWVGPRETNSTDRFAVGRLYRFATNLAPAQVRAMADRISSTEAERNAPMLAFWNPVTRLALSAPVVDGIVHFRVIAYRADGTPLYGTNLITLRREYNEARVGKPLLEIAALEESLPGESVQYSFSSDSFPVAPSAIEIEMGIIEPQVLRQYQSIAEAQPAEGNRFLARNAGKIHLFRQRISLRNAAPY